MKNLDEFRKRIVVLILIVAISVFLLLLDSVGILTILYDGSSVVSVPVQMQLRNVSTKANDIIGMVKQITTIKEENEKLKQENNQLLEKISTLEGVKDENEALRDQLSLIDSSQEVVAQARVISTDLTFENTIQINAGKDEGVELNDVVVYGKYAVGTVKKISKNSSRIQLITSNMSNIPVRSQKNKAIGIVRGEVGLTLKMSEILPDEKIEEGEIIVTSGVESSFPAGFIIGVVRQVDSDPTQAIKNAFIESQIDFAKLDYVFIIKKQEL